MKELTVGATYIVSAINHRSQFDNNNCVLTFEEERGDVYSLGWNKLKSINKNKAAHKL